MPITLPGRIEAHPAHALRRREEVAVFWVVARMNFLNWRMTRVSDRWTALGRERDQRRLLAAARTWCRLSARLADLRGVPETPQARELQTLFGTTSRDG